MPDGPTLEHTRLAAIEIGGRAIEIKSAELVRIQHWNGDEPAQTDWEVTGRTEIEDFPDGVQPVVLVIRGTRLRGRGVLKESRSYGMSVFRIFGLDPLIELDR